MSLGLFLCLVALAQTSSCLWFNSSSPTSYAKYKEWTTPSRGELTLFFRTNRADGLLLYKDEMNFECLEVSLTGGTVRLRLAMFKCRRKIAHVWGNFSDSKWHRVRIGFNNEKTDITVDETWRASINCSGRAPRGFTKLTGGMFIGGLPTNIDLQQLALPSSYYQFWEKRFSGCISGVVYSAAPRGTLHEAKLDISEGTKRGCTDPCSKCEHSGKCVHQQRTFRCNCGGTGHEEPFCRQGSPMIKMNGSSYILYNMTRDLRKGRFFSRYVAVRMRTRMADGLVLHTGLRDAKQKDYFVMELKGGSILVKMEHGGGEIVMRGGRGSLHDKTWHWIQVQRRQRNVVLVIDNKVVSRKRIPGKFTRIDFSQEKAEMYIGGGPMKELTKSDSKQNFSGVLQQFRLDKVKVLLRARADNERVFRIFGSQFVEALPTTTTLLKTSPYPVSNESRCHNSSDACSPLPGTTTPAPSPGPKTDEVRSPTISQWSKPSNGVPRWPILVIIIVTALTAVMATIFFVLRWHKLYAGSYVPEQTRRTKRATCSNGQVPRENGPV